MTHATETEQHTQRAAPQVAPPADPRARLVAAALAGTGALARGASQLVRATPVPLRYVPTDAITALLGRAWPGRRLIVRNYAALTGLPPDHPVVRALARRSLRNFGRMAVDFLAARAMRAEDLLRWVTPLGEPYVAAAHAAGRGVIFAMPHLGSWDVAGAYAAAYGFPVTAVVENDLTARLVAGARAYEGVTLVARDRSLRALFTALARNQGVMLISDIAHGDTHTTQVPFFGRPAAFPTGPAQLALRTGAPIIVLGCVRLDDGTYRIEAAAPLWPEAHSAGMSDQCTAGTVNGQRGVHASAHTPVLQGRDGTPAARGRQAPDDAAVWALTARVADGYARLVAQYPDHWYPFHQVWDDVR